MSCVTSEWLLRRYRPRIRWRLRLTTVIVLMIVAASIVLANLSFDLQQPPFRASSGWPLIWYWHAYLGVMGTPLFHGWDYSAARLAGNLAIWLLILTVAGLMCERLLGRYRPRLRWSLRTMLVAVGLAAVLCAWCAAARSRARQQDAVVALAGERNVYFERWGPKWLDLVGADPLRRRIVAVQAGFGELEDEARDDELLKRLAQVPDLRCLEIKFDVFSPGIAAALGEMRQLRMLSIECWGDDEQNAQHAAHQCLAAVGKLTRLERLALAGELKPDSDDLAFLADLTDLRALTIALNYQHDVQGERECLRAVGELTQLERLYLTGWGLRSEHLAYLGGLTNLKSLTIDSIDDTEKDYEDRESYRDYGALRHLPILPKLEAVDLTGAGVGYRDLLRLAEFPRLKSLALASTTITGPGLAELAPLESLENLGIGEQTAIFGFESLNALKRLKEVHISTPSGARFQAIDQVFLTHNGAEGVLRELEALRHSHPGIAIDTDYYGFLESEFQGSGEIDPPWDDNETVDRGVGYSSMRRLIGWPSL
ncbi:MAG TPA: hypothetical protein VFI31_04495 [Pirellulales bacterium]|nr:hypothetical protein [Pirellulales bacterium]